MVPFFFPKKKFFSKKFFPQMRTLLSPIHLTFWGLQTSKRNWTKFAKLSFTFHWSHPLPFKTARDSKLFISQQHNASCPTAWPPARDWLERILRRGYCHMALSQAFTNSPYYWQCRNKQTANGHCKNCCRNFSPLHWCPIYLWLYFTWALKSNDKDDNFRSELGLCICLLFLL